MGFPKEGLEMWRLYDDKRRMKILTAHGLTEPVTPECGCWGQGAEESPLGWLAFMCWMSDYIKETKNIDPYSYTVNEEKEIHAHKVIYADDGTYVSQTKEGMQKIANAIADFSTATGIIVKPEKSYVQVVCLYEFAVVCLYEFAIGVCTNSQFNKPFVFLMVLRV